MGFYVNGIKKLEGCFKVGNEIYINLCDLDIKPKKGTKLICRMDFLSGWENMIWVSMDPWNQDYYVSPWGSDVGKRLQGKGGCYISLEEYYKLKYEN